jgi:hypothetical protein
MASTLATTTVVAAAATMTQVVTVVTERTPRLWAKTSQMPRPAAKPAGTPIGDGRLLARPHQRGPGDTPCHQGTTIAVTSWSQTLADCPGRDNM